MNRLALALLAALAAAACGVEPTQGDGAALTRDGRPEPVEARSAR